MTKILQQGKGSAVDLVMAFEDSFASAPSSGGKKLAFNSSNVASSRDLNTSETIQSGRNPIEPFQGNGEVGGDITLPLDLSQVGYILKGAFGEPVTVDSITTGYKEHAFAIKDEQPSFTLEQLHKDLAEDFVFQGCKISKLSFNANTDGQENVYTMSIMGSKPMDDNGPIPISSITKTSNTLTLTTSSAHGLQANDEIVIAGITGLSGRKTVVSSSSVTSFTIQCPDGFTPPASIASGQEPVMHKIQIVSPGSIALNRLGTFSAKLYKDSEIYKCAKSFTLDIDFGIDGEQRVIGDNGYRSELPEGTVGITITLTALFKSGELFQAGRSNETVSLKLVFEEAGGEGKLVFDMPNCKIQETSPAIDTPRGLSQELTAQAFSSSGNVSAIQIALKNKIASY